MVSKNYSKGTNISEIDTPSIVVDLDIAESNISKMQSVANENNVSILARAFLDKWKIAKMVLLDLFMTFIFFLAKSILLKHYEIGNKKIA